MRATPHAAPARCEDGVGCDAVRPWVGGDGFAGCGGLGLRGDRRPVEEGQVTDGVAQQPHAVADVVLDPGGGMSFILSGLKSVLETGEPLVPEAATASV